MPILRGENYFSKMQKSKHTKGGTYWAPGTFFGNPEIYFTKSSTQKLSSLLNFESNFLNKAMSLNTLLNTLYFIFSCI